MKDEGIPEREKLNRTSHWRLTYCAASSIRTTAPTPTPPRSMKPTRRCTHWSRCWWSAAWWIAKRSRRRRKQASERLRREYVERGMAVAMQEFGVSKYEFQGGAEIDCENRIHLCKAACCRLPFALSKQDVQEGVVKWDLGSRT